MTLLAVLFFGVMLGMQQASEGINDMKGFQTDNYKGAFQIQQEGENVQASVLGESITSHDLAEKKQSLEDVKAFNIFSAMAEKLSQSISSLFRFGVNTTVAVIEHLIKIVFV